MKERTLWVPRCKPAPAGWRFCEMTRCLVSLTTDSQITDQFVESLPRLLATCKPDLSGQWFYEPCMRAGPPLDPADLYHDTGKPW